MDIYIFPGLVTLMKTRDSVITRLAHLLPSSNKNVQIGMSTVMLNYAVAATSVMPDEDAQVQCMTSIGMLFLDGLSELEAIYRWDNALLIFLRFLSFIFSSFFTQKILKIRTLVALGTLMHLSPENVNLAHRVEIKTRVETWRLASSGAQKVQECSQFVLGMLQWSEDKKRRRKRNTNILNVNGQE